MWKPSLEFASSPPRAGPASKRRTRRKKVQTPAAPRVKSVQPNDTNEDPLNLKWVSPQFDQDMQMRARVEHMTRGKGGRQQTVLAVATHIRSTRASLHGRGEDGDSENPPLRALDENVTHRRRRKKGEPRQLDLTGGCTRGTRKARGSRGRGKRGQATKTVVSRDATVREAFLTSSSTESEVSDGETQADCQRREESQRDSEEGVERESTENDILNVSEHLEAMTLDDQQPGPAPAAVTNANQRDTQDPCTTSSTAVRPQLVESQNFTTPPSLRRESYQNSASFHGDGYHGEDQFSGSQHCANSSILAEGTPTERFECGVFCTLRGKCNH